MSSTSLTSGSLQQVASLSSELSQQRGTAGAGADPAPSREAVVNRIDETALEASRELSEAELRELSRLQRRDDQMRLHEQVHVAKSADGALRRSFTYVRGADNKTYAVSNSLKADFTPVPNDPEATVDKMKSIKRAALSDEARTPQSSLVAGQAAARERVAAEQIAKQQRMELDAVGHEGPQDKIEQNREQNERLPRGTGSLGGGRNVVVEGPVNPETLRGTASAEGISGSSTPVVDETPLRKGSSSKRGLR